MPKRTLTIEYEEYAASADLPQDEQDLLASAQEAREKAYAPYSKFNVGAAVLTKDGHVLLGSNQETANYKGSCAEKVALDAAGVAGAKGKILKIAIAGDPESPEPITPCGQCRQDLKEAEDLSGEPITIILGSHEKIMRVVGIDQLLPFAFGPANLGISVK